MYHIVSFVIITKNLYLLGWDIKSLSPHINLFINIHTGNDKEDSRTSCSTRQESAKSENDCPLVLLNNFDNKEERKGK